MRVRALNRGAGCVLLAAAWALVQGTARAQHAVVPTGDGSAERPFAISELGHLVWMAREVRESAGKRYRLMNDIDAQATEEWNEGLGFEPIGDSWNFGFAGLFEGGGHALRSLVIRAPSYANDVGLFGALSAGAEVCGLVLEEGSVAGGRGVGGLVGVNNGGTVRGCRVSASVEGEREVGGLVGAQRAGLIEACAASGDVKGDQSVGGLAGLAAGRVLRSCATGEVRGGVEAGGLIGESSAAVRQCFASGAVTGDEEVGGLVGREAGGLVEVTAAGTPVTALAECYAIGRVRQLLACGDRGAVGNPGLRYTGVRWDVEACSQRDGEGVFGLTSERMKRRESYAGWDFERVWGIREGQSYPFLRALGERVRLKLSARGPGRVTVEPLKTEYEPGERVTVTAVADDESFMFGAWTGGVADEDEATTTVTMDAHKSVTAVFVKATDISSLEELQVIGHLEDFPLDGNYRLTRDLDASATAGWNDGVGFAPISASGYFTGIFEGNGHVIRGLHINMAGQNQVGLFRVVYFTGVVRHLGLVGGSVTGSEQVGALVGINAQGRIKGCFTAAEVTGYARVGGLAGLNSGTLEKSYARCDVLGTRTVGGVAGCNYDVCGEIKTCYAAGSVAGGIPRGGLVGENPEGMATAVRSYWDTEVSGCSSSAGGMPRRSGPMMRRATYEAWDFESDWVIEEGRSYPSLRRFDGAGPFSGTVTP